MVFRKNSLLLVAGSLLFCFCKKTDKTTSPSAGSGGTAVSESRWKIKTEETKYSDHSSKTEFFYNTSGKLQKMLFNSGDYSTFEWKPGFLVETSFSGGSSQTSTTTYSLDAVGNATAYANSDIMAYLEYADGYLTHSTYHLPNLSIEQNFSFQNGNQISGSDSHGNTYTYEYYGDKLTTVSVLNKGYPAFGKQNKHLLRKSIQNSSGGTTETNYSYEFDSRNRVIKQIEITEGDTAITSYTYY